jgi:hypothetical protein
LFIPKSEVNITLLVLQILKEKDFRIMEGVDSAEVLDFAKWVESGENLDN